MEGVRPKAAEAPSSPSSAATGMDDGTIGDSFAAAAAPGRRRPRSVEDPARGRVRTVLEAKPLAVWAYNTHLACSSAHTALHNDAQLRTPSRLVSRCASLGVTLQSYAQLFSITTQWR